MLIHPGEQIKSARRFYDSELLYHRQTLAPSLVNPDTNRVWGVDISHWDGPVDMVKLKASGAKFVVIKAANGALETQYYTINRDRAKAVGMLWGAYVWCYPASIISTSAQLNRWQNLLGQEQGDLPITLDFEWTSPTNPTARDLNGLILGVESWAHKTPMIYTAPGYWVEFGNTVSVWSKYPLWIAHYGVPVPRVPAPWINYKIWQAAEDMDAALVGIDPNFSHAVDLNYFNGSLEGLYTFAGVTAPPPPVPAPEPPPDYIVAHWIDGTPQGRTKKYLPE